MAAVASSKPVPSKTVRASTFNIVSGDKGGVGKSVTALALIDYLLKKGEHVVVFEADKANPDVARMYRGAVECCFADLTTETGWMDVMDTVNKHPGSAFVMSTPAGVGGMLKINLPSFKRFVAQYKTPIQLILWWVMNPQHDSVNLLADAQQSYGNLFDKTCVVCNTHFSDNKQDAFFLWNESPLKTKMEKAGTPTMYLQGLSLRVVTKLFHPEKIMPFADAVDAALGESVGLSESERFKLQDWRERVGEGFDAIYPWPNRTPELAVEALRN